MRRLAFPELKSLEPPAAAELARAARDRLDGLRTDPEYGNTSHVKLTETNLRRLHELLERIARPPDDAVSARDAAWVLKTLRCERSFDHEPDDSTLLEALDACPTRVVVGWRASAEDVAHEAGRALEVLGCEADLRRAAQSPSRHAAIASLRLTAPHVVWLKIEAYEDSDSDVYLLLPRGHWAALRNTWLGRFVQPL